MLFSHWIQLLQLIPGVRDREAPIDHRSGGVPFNFPSTNFAFHDCFAAQSAIQTLYGQDRDFDLGHVQPTAMLGCVMKLQFPGQLPRLLGWKSLVKRSRRMGVEIIQHHPDLFGLRKVNFNQIIHAPGEILLGAAVGDFDMPPTCQGLQKHEQVTGAFPLVFKVIAQGFSVLHRQGQPGFAHHLIGHLVKTDHWKGWLIRLGVQIQDIFHSPDKFGTNDGRDTPFLTLPGFEIVFFSTSRTASYERLSSRVSATRRSASSCNVQRTRPSGGWLWAKVVKIVLTLSSILGSRPARGSSLNAKSRLPSTNLCRVRRTVNQLVCKSSAISKSGFPALAKSRIFARLIFLAPGRPFWVSVTNSAFSASFKSTINFFAIADSFMAFWQF